MNNFTMPLKLFRGGGYWKKPLGLTGRRAVAGLFHDRYSPDRAIDDLIDPGFSRDRISVTLRDSDRGNVTQHHPPRSGARSLGAALIALFCGTLLWKVIGGIRSRRRAVVRE